MKITENNNQAVKNTWEYQIEKALKHYNEISTTYWMSIIPAAIRAYKNPEESDIAWKMVLQDIGDNISDIINQDGDSKTDGEVIDEIVDLLKKHNLYKERK